MSEAAIEGLSGALGASISLLATYPLQTISTRQATKRNNTEQDGQNELNGKIAQAQLGSYYQGIRPALVGAVASQGLYFYFYATLRKAIQQRTPRARQDGLSVPQSLAVASLAGSMNVLATNPIWLTVTRMQTAATQQGRASFFREIEALYTEGGLRALWRGTVPSLIMVINPTIQYALYELGTKLWRQRRGGQVTLPGPPAALSSGEVFVLASLAKLGATLATYPLLVVKNRTQAARKEQAHKTRANFVSIVRQIWEQQGCLGFFAGMRAKLVQSVLAAALMFVLKERLHQLTLRAMRRLS
eukprot:jgi/Ulvmu1/4089/UM019_0068.1